MITLVIVTALALVFLAWLIFSLAGKRSPPGTPPRSDPRCRYVTIRVLDPCGCLRWYIHPDGFTEPAYGPCPPHEAMAEVERLARRRRR